MATSNFIQSVKDETKGADRSVKWYRAKIKEFGKPVAMDLIRDGKRNKKQFYGKLNMFFYNPKLILPLVQPNSKMNCDLGCSSCCRHQWCTQSTKVTGSCCHRSCDNRWRINNTT